MTEARFRLRSDISITPVRIKQGISYIVEESASSKILRIGASEYALCSQFVAPQTIQRAIAALPKETSTKEPIDVAKLQRLAGWVMQSGMIEPADAPIHRPPSNTQSGRADDTSHGASKRPPTPPSSAPTKLFDPSFFRIKVLSAKTIDRACRPIRKLLSLPILAIAMVLWGAAISLSFQHWEEMRTIGGKLFVPGSQWWWMIAWLVLKAVHEFGHAVACARAGIRTSGAGIGFMFFAPTPYVDVTRVWNIENKWTRILVSASGMLFEMTLASIAIIVACWTDNPSLKYLCVSIATLGTFTTLAFNANPLMRYDGYYIAIDLLNRPNLWQDANRAMRSLMAGLFVKDKPIPTVSLTLISYGIASWCSRMLMLATMGWGVFIGWDGIGLLIVGFFVCLWYIAPVWMRSKQSQGATQPSAWRNLSPIKLFRAAIVTGCVGCLGLLPSPIQVYWPGVVDYVDPQDIRSSVPGFIVDVMVHDGQGVKSGDPIIQLSNPDLELECESARTAYDLSIEKCNALRSERKLTELQNEESMQESLRVHYERLKAKVDGLCVRATREGILLARGSHQWIGSFIQEGGIIGLVANPGEIEVKASIPQREWDLVSHRAGSGMRLGLEGGTTFRGRLLHALPRTQEVVDSPALAAIYGGPLVVNKEKSAEGEDKLKTTQPRLVARIELEGSSKTASSHVPLPPVGAICRVRFAEAESSIWGMMMRWGKALIDKKLPSTKST